MLDQEILDAFCEESLGLVNQLDEILTELEKNPDSYERLENFGQVIDRIMGAAKTIELSEIATFCELGKTIGYKAGQTNDKHLINVVTAVLFDTTFLLRKMLDQVKSSNQNILATISTKAFTSRLRWLSQKFSNIERSSVKVDPMTDQLSQANIDELMSNLGL